MCRFGDTFFISGGIMEYPKPKKVSHETKIHDQILTDDYFWMRNRESDDDVMKLLNAENDLFKTYLKNKGNLKETIFEELKSRELQTYETCPYPHDDYEYYERYEEGKDYPIHLRRHLKSGEVQVCLDENELAKGHDFLDVGAFDISPCHRYLIYTVDYNGDELYDLYILDLSTNKIVQEGPKKISYSPCWFNDSKTYAYIEMDENLRPYKIHVTDMENSFDKVVYTEDSGEYFLSLEETMDHQYILINVSGSSNNSVLYMKADASDLNPIEIFPKEDKIEYSVESDGDDFIVLTNKFHENFSLLRTPIMTPSYKDAKVIIEGTKENYLTNFNTFKDFMVLHYRTKGLNRFAILKDEKRIEASFPEDAYFVGGGDNANYETKVFRYEYSSLTTPTTTFDYDIESGESKKIHQKEVPGFDQSKYEVERTFAPSHDGAMVPMTIIKAKTTKKGDPNKCLLYGYGSYSMSIHPWFNRNIISLLDRGFVYAIGHIRGSSTLGRHWYENGKFLYKKNTFEDFYACGKFLINEGYTVKGKLGIMGGSAGGMLVGATINLDKENLIGAAVADVPFVDVLNTMLDDTLPLTKLEYEEWGNPNDKEYFDYMKSYCPYTNLEKREYPAVLAIGGLNDPRVTYWEPMKWTYKLRDLATDSRVKLLWTNMEAGHAGASGRFEAFKEVADIYTFLINELE
ncbi:S9 family peptidase [Halobacteriovorax vibrionivorans]|uniref:S9 family peptidase n=2 Tax=Halobacteriovoraceae TaxID=1652132 RepID=A0ABY0IIR3_9BACT|nr:S9 family peptidase [Halobacteriovorax vibrionivorans]TGD47367.1 S9 family peptidase [Halobacteriovorax sp. Y22]